MLSHECDVNATSVFSGIDYGFDGSKACACVCNFRKRPVPVKCGLPFLMLNPQAVIRNSNDMALLLLVNDAGIDLHANDGSTALMWVSLCPVCLHFWGKSPFPMKWCLNHRRHKRTGVAANSKGLNKYLVLQQKYFKNSPAFLCLSMQSVLGFHHVMVLLQSDLCVSLCLCMSLTISRVTFFNAMFTDHSCTMCNQSLFEILYTMLRMLPMYDGKNAVVLSARIIILILSIL